MRYEVATTEIPTTCIENKPAVRCDNCSKTELLTENTVINTNNVRWNSMPVGWFLCYLREGRYAVKTYHFCSMHCLRRIVW